MVWDRICTWWERHVKQGIEPPMEDTPDTDVLKRIIRVPGKWAEVEDEIIKSFRTANAMRLAAEKSEEACKARLLAEAGDAEGVRAKTDMDLPEITLFSSPGRVTYGKSERYHDHCRECGVGSKEGSSYIVVRQRERTSDAPV